MWLHPVALTLVWEMEGHACPPALCLTRKSFPWHRQLRINFSSWLYNWQEPLWKLIRIHSLFLIMLLLLHSFYFHHPLETGGIRKPESFACRRFHGLSEMGRGSTQTFCCWSRFVMFGWKATFKLFLYQQHKTEWREVCFWIHIKKTEN